MKIGIVLESLGLPVRQGLEEANRLGVGGVQVDAAGDLSPDRLTDTGRREFRNRLRSLNLQLTALNCPLRHGLDTAENQQPRIEHVRKVMTLAYELGPRIVVVQMPRVPDDPATERARLLREALLALGAHGDRVGTTLALEVGLDSGEKVRDYLNTYDTGSLGVNFDPANFLLNGFDPAANLLPLAGKVVHVHARDARTSTVSRAAQEVPLGAGDIEWMGLIGALEGLEYRGWVDVERETGTDRRADVAAGVAFLRRLVP